MTSAEITEKLKRVLMDPEGVTQGNLAKLATEYALHCRRLNANVERALSAYRSGALCDSKRILDEYSVFEEFRFLNIDGKEDWRAVCRTLGFEIAVIPPAQTIEELRAFAVVYERTSALFSEQRRLALEGGSNARRLQILYALESAFPQYDFWKVSIKDLERERVEEIASCVKETTKQNVDFSFIAAALQELEDSRRRSRAPEELLNKLRAWKEYVENNSALQRLRVLLEEWKKARDADDDFQTLACLQYFRDGNLSKATTFITAEERDFLNEAIRRAQKIERRETARVQLKRKSRELSRALETESNTDRLADLFASTELESDKAGETIDPSVSRAYQRRMESLEIQKRRRRLALVLALGATLILFGAASTLVVKSARSNREIAAVVDQLTSKLQDYEGSAGTIGRVEALEEAETIVKSYEKKNAEFLKDPAYSQTLDRVKNARTQENRRLREFEDDASAILSAHRENRSSPSALKNLKTRCKTERERKVYLKLKQKDDELERESNARTNEFYSQKLDQLVAAVAALEENPDFTESDVSKIRRGLGELKNVEAPDAQARSKILEALDARLDKLENRLRQSNQEEATQEAETTTEVQPAPDSESGVESNAPSESEIDDDAFDEVLKALDE